MDKISPIKQRILYFIDNQDIKKNVFCELTGISYSNLKGKSLYSEIGGTQIAEILSKYSEISPDWLLTGKGNMIRGLEDKKEEINPMAEKDSYIIELQKKEIDRLEEKLQHCQDEKKLLENNKLNV